MDRVAGRGPQWYHALLASLPQAADEPSLEINSIQSQPHKLRNTQACCIEHLHHGAVANAGRVVEVRCGEQSIDIIRAQKVRKPGKRSRRLHYGRGVLIHCLLEQKKAIETTNCGKSTCRGSGL